MKITSLGSNQEILNLGRWRLVHPSIAVARGLALAKFISDVSRSRMCFKLVRSDPFLTYKIIHYRRRAKKRLQPLRDI
jgi:hypothetical protein